MKIRKDMIFAILTTFCMCALMFTVIPIRSGLPYDPWADYNDDNKIDMHDIGNVAARFGTLNTDNLTRNVNVTNWPQDRPLTIKKGVEKIVLMQAMDGGSGNGYALSLGKMGVGQSQACLVYDFEPKGQLVNITEIYLNIIWRGDVAGTIANPHYVTMTFYEGPLISIHSDFIDLSSSSGSPMHNMPVGPSAYDNAVKDYNPSFNYTLIQPGMNLIRLIRYDSYGDHIFIFSLEMFFEYYYWG
jgi:hypothetical protein